MLIGHLKFFFFGVLLSQKWLSTLSSCTPGTSLLKPLSGTPALAGQPRILRGLAPAPWEPSGSQRAREPLWMPSLQLSLLLHRTQGKRQHQEFEPYFDFPSGDSSLCVWPGGREWVGDRSVISSPLQTSCLGAANTVGPSARGLLLQSTSQRPRWGLKSPLADGQPRKEWQCPPAQNSWVAVFMCPTSSTTNTRKTKSKNLQISAQWALQTHMYYKQILLHIQAHYEIL